MKSIIPEYRLDYFGRTARQRFGEPVDAAGIFITKLYHLEQDSPPALVFYGLDDKAQDHLSQEQQNLFQAYDQETINIVLEVSSSGGWDAGQEMLHLHESLCQHDFTFPAFDIAYGIYWIKSNPGLLIDSEHSALYDPGCSFLSRLAVGADRENGIDWGRVISQTLAELPPDRNKKSIRSLYSLPGMPASQVLKWLPAYMADDIKASLNSQRTFCLSITIKGYEKLFIDTLSRADWLDKDYWLRELIAHLPEIMWIILSSIKVPWDEYYPQWKNRLQQYLTGRLNNHDILDHLISQGIIEYRAQEAILNFSQGIPYYLDIAAKSYR